MTEDKKKEKRRLKFEKWRARIDKMEARISETIFKVQIQQRNLWKACPHEWGVTQEEDPMKPSRIWNQCKVCKGIRLKTLEEVVIDSL